MSPCVASNRDIWSCGQWSCIFHLHAEKTSLIGLMNGEYGGRNSIVILSCAANHFQTMLAWWKLTLSHTMTKFGKSVWLNFFRVLVLGLCNLYLGKPGDVGCYRAQCVGYVRSHHSQNIVMLPRYRPGVLIVARPAFGQIEPRFIYKNDNVGRFLSFQVYYSLQCAT